MNEKMNEIYQNDKYIKAKEYATKMHEGQIRKGGLAYITHPVRVSEMLIEKGYGLDFAITGLFHDLLEDTKATEEEILSLGNEKVLTAVKLLTKVKPYVMQEYIDGIKSNEIAKAVKACDRLHNLQCAIVADEEFKRKYILESIDWYMDFDEEIPKAVKKLAQSLEKPMTELSFLYEPVDDWIE